MNGYDAVILAEAALQAFFKLNDSSGTVAVDSSGHGFNGLIPVGPGIELNQTPLLADGESSVLFTGSPAQISLPAGLELPVPLSIEFWCKSPPSPDQFIISSGAWNISGPRYPYGGIVSIDINTDVGEYTVNSTNTITPGTVYYCVFTIDALFNFSLYIASGGGPLTLWATSVGTGTHLAYTNGGTFPIIGNYVGGGSQFDGNVEKVAFYNQVLTLAQMNAHYSAGLVGLVDVTPTTVNLVVGGPPSNVTVQQINAGPGTLSVTGGNPLIATAVLSSPDGPGPVALTLTAVAPGTTVWTVNGSDGFTQNVTVTVTSVPVPPIPFTGPETQFPFKPQASESQSQTFAYDVVISEAFPGVVFEPTEPNGQYQEIREVSGDLWLVTNAQFNTNTLTFQQNSPCNPADPAYAWRLMANGNSIRYSAVATTAPNINVTWVQMFEVDGAGNINSTPLVQTTPVDNLQLEPIWNVGTPTTTGSFEQDVTDTSSAANSFLEKFKVNGTVVWQVRKDGTLVNGIVPFANVTGPFNLNNATFTGTSTFTGPADFEDGINVSGAPAVITDGETVTGGLTTDSLHDTGNAQIDGTETVTGALNANGGVNTTNVDASGTVTGSSLVLTGSNPVISYVGEIVNNIAGTEAGALGDEGIPIPRANPSEGWNLFANVVALGSAAGNPFTFTFTAAAHCTGGPYTTTLTSVDNVASSGDFTADATANNTTNIPSINISVTPGGLGKVLLVLTATRVS
jgi:hypothetical protein